MAAIMLLTPMWALRADATLGLASDSETMQAEQVINFYATQYNTTYTIKDSMVLKSLSGGDNAYTLYTLDPYGYAILLSETNSLMEACYVEGSSAPIDIDTNKTIYYGGPNSFFTKSADTFYHVTSDYSITQNELSNKKLIEADVRANEKSHAKSNISNLTRGANSLSTYYSGYSYFSTLSNHGVNTNGTCTVLAIAILLGYYDNFVNEDYVESRYEQGNGTSDAFHLYLNTLVYGTPTPSGGVYIRNTVDAINLHLRDFQMTSLFSHGVYEGNASGLANAIIAELISGYPVVASMDPIYGGLSSHTVVIYGVTFDISNPTSTAVYTAHMGYRNAQDREVLLNYNWFYEYGYIDCSLSSHLPQSNWAYYNGVHCKSLCHCGYATYRQHSINSSRYCVYCDTLII